MIALDVFHDDDLVGTLHDTEPVSFTYASAWLVRPQAFALSTIRLQAEPITSPEVMAFFENLLPEGDLRFYLSQQRKASTLFALLLVGGRDRHRDQLPLRRL